METTPYQRLEEFWLSKDLKNASAFAEAIKKKPGTISALKQRKSRPGNDLMLAIQNTFPDLNPDYILWGTGPMLRDGRELTRQPAPTPPAVERPSIPLVAPTHREPFVVAQAPVSIDLVGKLVSALEKQAEDKDLVIERQNEQLQKKDRLIESLRYIIETRLGIDDFPSDELEEPEEQPAPRKKLEGNWNPAAANAAQFRVKLEAMRKPARLIDQPTYRRPGFRQEAKVLNFHTYLNPSYQLPQQEKKTA